MNMQREAKFYDWWSVVVEDFRNAGLREPLYGEAKDAYKEGKTVTEFLAWATELGPDWAESVY